MGTRNLTCAVVNGEYKVNVYGQYDGYPDGQGLDIYNILSNCDLDLLKENVSKCSSLDTQEKIDELFESVVPGGNQDDHSHWSIFYEKLPYLSRNTAGKIFKYILEKPLVLKSELEFAADSLFCEWAYVVDFDKRTFEVYKGFNKEPLTEEDRFFFLEEHSEDGYHPVKLVVSFPLDNLPPTSSKFLDFFREVCD